MTALAFLLIAGGVVLVYAGITNADVLGALKSVLSGKKPTHP